MRRAIAGAVCIANLVAAPVWSATVSVKSGAVYLSHGKGFRVLTGSTSVSPETSVMTKSGGSAEIVYDDGCKVQVEPGSLVTVNAKTMLSGSKVAPLEQSPCSIGAISSPLIASPSALAGGAITAGVGSAGVAGAVDSYVNSGSTSP